VGSRVGSPWPVSGASWRIGLQQYIPAWQSLDERNVAVVSCQQQVLVIFVPALSRCIGVFDGVLPVQCDLQSVCC
jgi:hypothetical protein